MKKANAKTWREQAATAAAKAVPGVVVDAEVVADEPPVRKEPRRESCRVVLTTEQLLDAGRDLAATEAELRQMEDDFKSVRDEWKSRISALEARRTTTAGRISRGYDMKDIPCTVYMDVPEPGTKTCFRDDTGERVWVREMTDADKQLPLPLEDGEVY